MAKTIVEKLSLNKYQRAAVLNAPVGKDYMAGLVDYETELTTDSIPVVR